MTPAPKGHEFDAIRAEYPILEEAQRHTKLKKSGAQWVGLCPIHNEKSPSFFVNPSRERFKCHGCGATGDVIDLVTSIKQVSISEAIADLTGGRVAVMSEEKQRARDRIRADREDAEEARREAAKIGIEARWNAATAVNLNHPYLVRKGIAEAFEHATLRQEGVNLLVPVWGEDTELQTLQTIPPEDGGKKLFASNAPAAGGRYSIGICMGRSIICEGLATGATLWLAQSDQVVMALSADNMERIAREYAAAGTFVVLAVDQDKRERFEALAREINAVAIVAEGPTKGWDFNDEHQRSGIEAVTKRIADGIAGYAAAQAKASAARTEEEGPLDLWRKVSAPPFPDTLLPPIIARFARIRADMVGCDPSGLAMAALASCGAIISDKIQLRMKKHDAGWKEEARLWVMLVGDPSRKKTPILRAATKRIADIDADMMQQYQRDMRDWTEAGGNGEPPTPTRLRISDITMEAAAEVCAYSPAGVLALQDELSGWFGGIEKYSGGKGGAKDRSFWLQAFNGGHYATDRVGRKAAFVENLSISIVGGVQPDPIRRIMADASDDGLIQRFFPIMLGEPVIGQDIEMPDVALEYDELIEKLHVLAPPKSFLGAVPLIFSDEAQALRSRLERDHLDMMTSFETANRKIASHIGKYDGLFGRLCVIFHCIEHVTRGEGPLPEVIGIDTATRASRLLHEFLRRHAMAFYTNVAGLTDDHEIMKDVAGYILSRREEKVTLRTLARGTRLMRSLTRYDGQRIFDQLAAHGWLEETQARSDASAWTVNPQVHERYADRATHEKMRRDEARTKIMGYLEN